MTWFSTHIPHIIWVFVLLIALLTLAGWYSLWQAGKHLNRERRYLVEAQLGASRVPSALSALVEPPPPLDQAVTETPAMDSASIEADTQTFEPPPLPVLEGQENLSSLPTAERLLQSWGLEGGEAATSLIVRRIRRMESLARTRFSNEAVLVDLLERGVDLKPRFAQFVGSILVFVALIGTTLGLSAAVSALPTFSDNTKDYQALNALVRHIAPAFLITFAGILGTVVMASLNYRYTQKQDKFLLDVEEFTLETLAPLLLADPHQVDQARIAQFQQRLLDATGQLTEVVIGVGQDMSRTIETLREGAETRAQEFQQKLLEGVAHFQANFTEKLDDSHQRLTTHSEQIQTRLLESADSFAGKVEGAGSSLATASEQMAQASIVAVTAIPPAMQAATDLATVSKGAAEVINSTSTELQVTLQKLSLSLNLLPEHLKTLELACNRIGETVETSYNAQTDARSEMLATLQSWRQVAERLEALKSIMQQTYSTMQNEMDKVSATLVSDQREFTDALRRVGEAAQREINQLGAMQMQMVEGIGGRFDRAAEGYQTATLQAFRGYGDNLSGVTTETRVMLASLSKAVTELEETTQALKNALRSLPRMEGMEQVVAAIRESRPAPEAFSESPSDRTLRQVAEALNRWTVAQQQPVTGQEELLQEIQNLTRAVQQMGRPPKRSRRASSEQPALGPNDTQVMPPPTPPSLVRRLQFWRRP